MSEPADLAAAYTSGQSFTAAAEDTVEIDINWTLDALRGVNSGVVLKAPLVNGYTEGLVALGVVGASQTLSIALGTVLTATLTASTVTTFTMPAHIAGKSQSFQLQLRQPITTGGGTAVFPGVIWNTAGQPVQTAAVNTMDIYTFVDDGVNWFAGSVQQGYPVLAAPVYDSSGMSSWQSSIASGTNFQWTQSATAGAYAIVALYQTNVASPMTLAATPTVATFGGQTMTSLGGVYVNNTSADGFIRVFTLPSVTTGGTNTISMTLTQAGLVFEGWGASFTYTNVASVGTLQTGYGQSTSLATVSVPSAIGNTVWGTAMCASAAGVMSAFSLTERQQYNTIANNPIFIAGDGVGAASVTVSAITNATAYWCAAGLNLI